MKNLRRDINSKLEIKLILRENNIKYINNGDSFKICCPFHKEDTPSCFISAKKKVFHCFGCNISGDLIFLIARIKKVTIEQIIANYSLKYGIDLNLKHLNQYEYLPIKTKLDELEELYNDLSYILNQKYELLNMYIKKLQNDVLFSDMFVEFYKLQNEIELLENEIKILRIEIFDEKRRE